MAYFTDEDSGGSTAGSGISELNGLTADPQSFATGNSGTDFNISSSSSTHTFNIPDATLTARGLVTTNNQSFAGDKVFANNVQIGGDIVIPSSGVKDLGTSGTPLAVIYADEFNIPEFGSIEDVLNGKIDESVIPAEGDIIVHSGAGAQRLPVGASGQVLKVDGSGYPIWDDESGGGGASPLTTQGDIYFYDADDDRLPLGTSGSLLVSNGTLPEWVSTSGVDWTPSFSVLQGTISDVNIISARYVVIGKLVYYELYATFDLSSTNNSFIGFSPPPGYPASKTSQYNIGVANSTLMNFSQGTVWPYGDPEVFRAYRSDGDTWNDTTDAPLSAFGWYLYDSDQ